MAQKQAPPTGAGVDDGATVLMSKRWRHMALVAAVGLAFALRAVGIDGQSLWRDEVDAIRFAQASLPELLRTFVSPGQNGPLYFLLLRPWLSLAGQSELALRFLSLVFGVLAVPLFYQLARELFGPLGRARQEWASLVAAVLAATSPYLVWYGQEGKMYSLVVALALTSMICYLAALRRGRWYYWLAYVVATTTACYVHLIAALLIPAQVLMFAIGPWDHRAKLKGWLLSLGALTLPYLPLLAWQVRALLQRVDTGYRFFPLNEVLLSLAADYSLGVAPTVTVWAVALFVALSAAGTALLVWPARKGMRRGAAWVLLSWLFVPVAAFFLITLRRPMFTTRYLIFVMPAYLLLISAGTVAGSRGWRSLGAVSLAAVLVLNGMGAWNQARTPIKADFRSATYYVIERLAPEDLILFQIPYGRYSFDYYVERWSELHPGVWPDLLPSTAGGTGAGSSYHWAEGLYTNAGMTVDEAGRQMAELTAGSRVVWLVATEVPMWDARGVVKGWLDGHGRRVDEAAFTGVTVWRYEMP